MNDDVLKRFLYYSKLDDLVETWFPETDKWERAKFVDELEVWFADNWDGDCGENHCDCDADHASWCQAY